MADAGGSVTWTSGSLTAALPAGARLFRETFRVAEDSEFDPVGAAQFSHYDRREARAATWARDQCTAEGKYDRETFNRHYANAMARPA